MDARDRPGRLPPASKPRSRHRRVLRGALPRHGLSSIEADGAGIPHSSRAPIEWGVDAKIRLGLSRSELQAFWKRRSPQTQYFHDLGQIYGNYHRPIPDEPGRVWLSSYHPADLDEYVEFHVHIDAEPTELRCLGRRGQPDFGKPDEGAAQPAGLGKRPGMGGAARGRQRGWVLVFQQQGGD